MGGAMGIIDALKDWISFRTMVTPVILKTLYQILFVLLNILGVLAIFGYLVITIIGALAALTTKNGAGAAIGMIGLGLIMVLAAVVFLLLYNLLLRIWFEVILLLFNIYDSLKEIEKGQKSSK